VSILVVAGMLTGMLSYILLGVFGDGAAGLVSGGSASATLVFPVYA